MVLRLLAVILGVVFAIHVVAAPNAAAVKMGLTAATATVPLALAAPVLGKASDLTAPAAGPGFGRTMCDDALRIALVMLALFGLWGLKRMMA
ncbi:MAG TPA: hypothetical protein VHD32_04410 [Candidatus Didemnitutus sp.]|nr:hypothetical protein [Candidatus Didemnitutus sp.]